MFSMNTYDTEKDIFVEILFTSAICLRGHDIINISTSHKHPFMVLKWQC